MRQLILNIFIPAGVTTYGRDVRGLITSQSNSNGTKETQGVDGRG
jgi:hypothetical protein